MKLTAYSIIRSFSEMLVLISLIFLPISQSYAKAGCCSKHGGVSGCNSSAGRLLCKDGTTSPSCPCENGGGGFFPFNNTKPAKVKPAKASTSTTTAPVEATTPKTKAKKSTAGCCSRHGGVAKCNKSTGYLMCKDGTQSTNCTCR